MTRRRLIALVCALTTLTSVAVVAPALAAGNSIINDCQSHGELTHQYTASELRHALSVLPSSVKQYTNCSDVINKALLVAAGGGTRTGTAGTGSGGSFLPTPVIIILVVLILAAVTFAGLAIRRRRSPDADLGDEPENPADGETGTRMMPSVPRDRPASDTAETRAMPSLPLAHDGEEGETRVIEPNDDQPEPGGAPPP